MRASLRSAAFSAPSPPIWASRGWPPATAMTGQLARTQSLPIPHALIINVLTEKSQRTGQDTGSCRFRERLNKKQRSKCSGFHEDTQVNSGTITAKRNKRAEGDWRGIKQREHCTVCPFLMTAGFHIRVSTRKQLPLCSPILFKRAPDPPFPRAATDAAGRRCRRTT